MAPAEVVLLAGGGEALEGVLAHDLKHREPPLVGTCIDHEALVGERAEHREHVAGLVTAADRLGGGQRPTADEDGESPEQPALGLVEQLVA